MADFVLVVGVLASAFVAMCLISAVVENFGSILKFIDAVIQVIAERILSDCGRNFKRCVRGCKKR